MIKVTIWQLLKKVSKFQFHPHKCFYFKKKTNSKENKNHLLKFPLSHSIQQKSPLYFKETKNKNNRQVKLSMKKRVV